MTVLGGPGGPFTVIFNGAVANTPGIILANGANNTTNNTFSLVGPSITVADRNEPAARSAADQGRGHPDAGRPLGQHRGAAADLCRHDLRTVPADVRQHDAAIDADQFQQQPDDDVEQYSGGPG